MTESPLPDKLPRYVIFRGKKARVLSYEDGKFEILTSNEQRFLVTRDRITFIKS